MQIEPAVFPTPLSAYPPPSADGILATLAARVAEDPFNLVVTAIFAIAILHTFAAARFTRLAHALQHRHDARLPLSAPPRPSVAAELLHFFGEVEVVFGLWAVVLIVAITAAHGWTTARHYVSETVNYTEPLFVVVIMALASTRPIIGLAERSLHARRAAGRSDPGGVVGGDPDDRADDGLVHHRTGRDDHRRGPARPAVLRPQSGSAPEIRDPRAALRQRLGRRHADPLRGAPRVDGGAPLGLGHRLHGDPHRLARGAGDRGVDLPPTS